MRNKKTFIGGILMLMLAFMVIVFGAQSFAKYSYKYHDELTGHYVDFRLTIEGASQTAVMYDHDEVSQGNTYKYKGIIPLKLVNEKDGEISKRDIQYDMYTPEKQELENKYVTDAWGDKFDILPDTQFYDVAICDELGHEYDPVADKAIIDDLKIFKENVRKEVKLYLSIKRRETSKIDPTIKAKPLSGETENISIVLKTKIPYKAIRILNIKVSKSLVIIDSEVKSYFGFTDLEVDIKTSKIYVYSDSIGQAYDSLYPTKIDFEINNTTMFDKERFLSSILTDDIVNGKYKSSLLEYSSSDAPYSKAGYYIDESNKANGTYHIILYLDPASAMTFNLYISNDASVKVKCLFSRNGKVNSPSETNNEWEYTNQVAGILKGGVVYPQG